MQTFDVIIVGGGMVGASLALALSPKISGQELKIALIDRHSLIAKPLDNASPWQPRVSAINEASKRLFQNLGCWQHLVDQRLCAYQNMEVWDGEGTGNIEFDAAELGFSDLGHIIENDVIRNALLMALADSGVKLYGDQVNLDFQLDPQSSHKVNLDDDVILQAPLLIAAEGAESPLRKLAGIPANQKDYRHHALVTTVETELNHQNCARQVFLDTGPLAFLPLPDQDGKHFCSIVWSLIPAEADRIMSLNDDAFCLELSRAFERRAGDILWTDKRQRFPLRQRYVRQYHRQGVAVVGDAAHTIHPLAGQGVNLGLMDVAVLAEELIRASRRGDRLAAKHILDRYERRQMGSNRVMQSAMAGFQNLFDASDMGIRWLRNSGLKLTNKEVAVKRLFIEQAMGLVGDLPELARL